MPYADEDSKKRWLRTAISNGYGKYLYQRRKCVQDDAHEFRQALETIMDVGDRASVQVAREAIAQSVQRWETLDQYKNTTWVEKKKEPDSLFEAVAKLGLK